MRVQPALPGMSRVVPRRDPREMQILAAIVKLSALWPDVMLHRNNTGALRNPKGRPVAFGLGKGSPDLVGSITVPCEGRRIARALAIEVKAERGRVRPEQAAWIHVHRGMGWAIAIVRSVEEAQRFVEGVRAWKE